MTVKIAIIGTGQIGASIGLALAEHKKLVERVGHDRELTIARQAEKMGAFDQVNINLPDTVEQADLVVLAIPLDQIRETMEVIADVVRPDVVIVDTAPVKQVVARWAKELLPPTCHYIGLTPVINAEYLYTAEQGPAAARADMFQRGLFAVITPPGTVGVASKLVTDFVGLLGAEHLFMDAAELDSIMAMLHITPELFGAALLNQTVEQVGWREARKLTGKPYALANAAFARQEGAAALAQATASDPDSVVRSLDVMIAALQQMRTLVKAGNVAALEETLQTAINKQGSWSDQRQRGNWKAEELSGSQTLPTAAEVFSKLFSFGRGKKPPENNK